MSYPTPTRKEWDALGLTAIYTRLVEFYSERHLWSASASVIPIRFMAQLGFKISPRLKTWRILAFQLSKRTIKVPSFSSWSISTSRIRGIYFTPQLFNWSAVNVSGSSFMCFLAVASVP